MDKLTYAKSLIDKGLAKEDFILEMEKFDSESFVDDQTGDCPEGYEKDENGDCVLMNQQTTEPVKEDPAVPTAETTDVPVQESNADMESTSEPGSLEQPNQFSINEDGLIVDGKDNVLEIGQFVNADGSKYEMPQFTNLNYVPKYILNEDGTGVIDNPTLANYKDIDIDNNQTKIFQDAIAKETGTDPNNWEVIGCLLYTSPSPRD